MLQYFHGCNLLLILFLLSRAQGGIRARVSKMRAGTHKEISDELDSFYESNHKLYDYFKHDYIDSLSPIYMKDKRNITKFHMPSFPIHINLFNAKLGEINAREETLVISIDLELRWNDSRLRWDPAEFDGIKHILLPEHRIWQPDFIFYDQENAAENLIPREMRYVRVRYTGEVVKPAVYLISSSCDLNMKDFPFDVQTCFVGMGSYVYEAHEISYRITIPEIQSNTTSDAYGWHGNSEWEMIKPTATKIKASNSIVKYEYIQIAFTLKRGSSFYMLVIIWPIFLINILSITGMFMNESEETYLEKVILGLTTLMAIAIELEITAQELPKTFGMPRLASYIFRALNIIALATVAIFFVPTLNRWRKRIQNDWLRRHFKPNLTVHIIFQLLNFINFCTLISDKDYEDFQRGSLFGMYFGANGAKLLHNIVAAWRDHFVLEDDVIETVSTSLTPKAVFAASGHEERFTDFLMHDPGTNESFKAESYLAEQLQNVLKTAKGDAKEEAQRALSQIANFDAEQLKQVAQMFAIKMPSGAEFPLPAPLQQMFGIDMATGLSKAYLRPETAQSIFVEFAAHLHANQGKLPCVVAQIGSAFRNEINPRQGLLRTREFIMAEIEHFTLPQDRTHPKFPQARTAFNRQNLELGIAQGLTASEAVESRVMSQVIAYYAARTQKFLEKIGINKENIRFRQHQTNEMAHYARECWDAEVLTSYGWIEVAGIADRGSYDLERHIEATGHKLTVDVQHNEPRKALQDAATLSKTPSAQLKPVSKQVILSRPGTIYVYSYHSSCARSVGSTTLTIDDHSYTLNVSDVIFTKKEIETKIEHVVPHVIEPSFGIGRILHAVLEHSFRHRQNDEKRVFLHLTPAIAPVKCSILPINSNAAKLKPIVDEVQRILRRERIVFKLDESNGSIGRRYARTDRIGIPFGVTVDFDSLADHAVTIRESASQDQVRVQLDELADLLVSLCTQRVAWHDVSANYPKFSAAPHSK